MTSTALSAYPNPFPPDPIRCGRHDETSRTPHRPQNSTPIITAAVSMDPPKPIYSRRTNIRAESSGDRFSAGSARKRVSVKSRSRRSTPHAIALQAPQPEPARRRSAKTKNTGPLLGGSSETRVPASTTRASES